MTITGTFRAFSLAVVVGLLASSGAVASEPIITRVDNPHMRVAITFDACATKTKGYGFDRAIYRILQRERIPATIFISGRWGEFHQGVMTELAADPLIEFGNHSYDHPHMSRLSDSDIQHQVDETEAVLARFGKRSVAFRPPFGDFNQRMVDVVRARGLPVVSWDVVSGDPSAAATAGGMIHAVSRQTHSGSIVIFHINGRGKQTAAALPSIARHLRASGLELVLLSTLLSSKPAVPAVVSSTTVPALPRVTSAPANAMNHPGPESGARPTAAGSVFCEPPELDSRAHSPAAKEPAGKVEARP